jgi:hypothetical protein
MVAVTGLHKAGAKVEKRDLDLAAQMEIQMVQRMVENSVMPLDIAMDNRKDSLKAVG